MKRQCDLDTDEWLSRFKWDYKKVQAKAHQCVERNSAFIEDDNKYVSTPFGRELISPEYVKRFEETKRLKEKITTYSGDRTFAEMEALRLKRQAEAENRDFIVAAIQAIEKMEGNHIVAREAKEETTIAIIRPSLWRRLINWLIPPKDQGEGMSVKEMMEWK